MDADAPAVIPVTSRGVSRTMADGTVRFTIEVEPRHAQAAFGLFGMPGATAAMARLNEQTPVPGDPGYVSPRGGDDDPPLKGGALARLAGQFGTNPEFQRFLMECEGVSDPTPETVRTFLCERCGIKSRRFLDHDEAAAQRFHAIRKKFIDWHGRS